MNAPKLDCLTSLRAFAAGLIVVQHTVGWDRLSKIPVVGHFPWDHGVSFFFVLSGFILTYVYRDLKPDRWREFFVARFARLWPAHIATLILGFALGEYLLHSRGLLLLNAAMLQSWLPFSASYFSYNGLSWSISTEFGFYLAFPFLIGNLSKTWHWKLAGAAGLLVAVISLSQYFELTGYSHNSSTVTYHGLVYISPLARLFEFVLGMCVGHWFLRLRFERGTVWQWTGLELLVPALAVANSLWGIRWLMTNWPAANEYLMHAGSLLSLAAVIFVYAHQRGYVARMLSHRWWVFLGEISFSIYLLHVILFWFIARQLPDWSLLQRHLLFWPLLLISASLMYVGVEQPARWLIRHLFARRQPRTGWKDSATAPTPVKRAA